ncbi:replicative DNA helicase [Borrelia yangtzensis]|uniref:Replicative DNA helicase n=1 Tax=Borreliella yangtzensis TaxID=683292 RepID=A0ABR6PAV5_9SPIR|nr:replicative DNA helicase [Borreliella yangtzensis]
MKRNYNVQIIFIDHISLITINQNNIPHFDQVAFLSRTIRALALELKTLITGLSQVTRSVQKKVESQVWQPLENRER